MPKEREAEAESGQLRADKWLWAARFFKSRSLAIEAINGGKVHLNGQRIKPAKGIKIGDEVKIRRGYEEYTVEVTALSAKRGPATVAALLYSETAESERKRQLSAEQRRLDHAGQGMQSQRPNKKQRRQLVSFTKGRL